MGNLPSSPVAETLTEKNIRDQTGKVFLITGATSGVGFELAKILYTANARVWILARSKSKAQQTINGIKNSAPQSTGKLEVLQADFNDLRTIKPAVDNFLREETRLDVLWNNAGIMIPPKGTLTEQGYEAQLGVNTLAPFLFTTLLTVLLVKTAQSSPASDTRVVWVSSSAAANFAPKGGVDMSALKPKNDYSQWQNYGVSKAGNILHAFEFARKYHESRVLSVAVDPGNLDTGLYQNMPKWQHVLAKIAALKPAIYGAYTELFAGLSKDVSSQKSGAWVIPWGKVATPRKDIAEACKPETEGGSGIATQFWEWCEKEVRPYA